MLKTHILVLLLVFSDTTLFLVSFHHLETILKTRSCHHKQCILKKFYVYCYRGLFVPLNAQLAYNRRLLDVYLQQNITADTDVKLSSLARQLIVNMLSSVPVKCSEVLFHVFCLSVCHILTWFAENSRVRMSNQLFFDHVSRLTYLCD